LLKRPRFGDSAAENENGREISGTAFLAFDKGNVLRGEVLSEETILSFRARSLSLH
jgi:hypothetical protein